MGTWDWEEGRIAGIKAVEETRIISGGKESSTGGDRYVKGEGLTGKNAMWLQGVSEGKYMRGPNLGDTTVSDGLVHWSDVPRTKVVFHSPGA